MAQGWGSPWPPRSGLGIGSPLPLGASPSTRPPGRGQAVHTGQLDTVRSWAHLPCPHARAHGDRHTYVHVLFMS